MPSVIAVAGFFVLTLGCAQWVVAKEDGVPGRRVGGGTRMEFPEKLPRSFNQASDRPTPVKKSLKTEARVAVLARP